MRLCEFCDEIAGGSRNNFSRRYGSNADRIIFRTEHICVIPSLGQIAGGHLLIVPAQHVTSMADLSGDVSFEFAGVYENVRRILRDHYGECIFFEHGVRAEGSGGCGIDHAHMHAVPVKGTGVLDVLRKDFVGYRVGQVGNANDILSQEMSYLYFESSLGERYVFETPCIPSQYMRKLVCECLGKEEWDWRNAGYEPSLVATLRTLSSEFATVLSPSGR